MSTDKTKPEKTEPAIDRRRFLKQTGGTVCGMLVVLSGLNPPKTDKPTSPRKDGKDYDWDQFLWGFVVDSTKCIGCGACARACANENKVPDGQYRTWVERYELLRDGGVRVDSPNGGIESFDPTANDPAQVNKAFFVPKLCNHCLNPPCVQVCPVGATFKSKDGVVLIDPDQCVGCGYCIQACPYSARFMHKKKHIADKCTLCYHRITKGLEPACVHVCPVGARMCGNIKDPKSKISLVVRQHRFGTLKPELGANPKCFYIGLDPEVI